MYVWPCAVVLAQYLWTQREQLRGRAVLEVRRPQLAAVWTRLTSCPSQLGAGVALPGVVAARCGSKVILSDLAEAPSCLENCRRSCRANGVQDVVVLGLTWGDLSPDLVLLPKLDIILGSDVFYDPEGQHKLLVCRPQRSVLWRFCGTGPARPLRTSASCFRF